MGLRGRSNLTEERIFFITTTVKDFVPVFSEDKYCGILLSNIKHYQTKYKFIILAYVIMPSHFHWIIINDPKHGTVSDVMRDIKKYSAWDILEELERSSSIYLNKFHQSKKQKRQFWYHRFDDEVIRNQKMFWQKLRYIHNNPVKAGLVLKPEDYKYSSARNYVMNDQSLLKVDIEYAGIEM